MSLTWTPLRAGSLRRERWKNGRGWTSPIVRVPDTDEWHWSLSLAESDRPAEFSAFPGVGRELVLLHGDGLRLRFVDGEVVDLREAGDSSRFSGLRRVVGEPLAGPTKQLNVMWRTDAIDARVTRRSLAGDAVVRGDDDTRTALTVLSGGCELPDASDGARLTRWDTLVSAPESEALRISGEAEILVITVREA